MEKSSFSQSTDPHPPDRMRIGLFTDSYSPAVNGIAVSLRLISEKLRAAGHHVVIFAPKHPGHEEEDPNVFRAPAVRYLTNPPFYVAVPGSPRYTWNLNHMHFDVVHANTPLTVGMLAYLTATTKNLPLIYTYHVAITDYTHHVKFIGSTRIIRRAARWFSAISTNLGDQVIVPSKKFLRILQAQNVRKPIHVIPNGIDLENFRDVRKKSVLHDRLGLRPETPILLSVGRVDPEKNLKFLVEALSALPPMDPAPHLVIVGDGGARHDLEAQAAATPVNAFIHFLGMVNRTDIPDILHDGTIFVSASTSEVHPLAMIEALAAGLPVVAVADAAYEGMVVDGYNGYQTLPDIQSFNTALCNLLTAPEKLKQFGQYSMELSDQFSITTQVQSLENLYWQAIMQNKLAGTS